MGKDRVGRMCDLLVGCGGRERGVMQREVNGIFFFNDAASTEIYTVALHDALPIDSV